MLRQYFSAVRMHVYSWDCWYDTTLPAMPDLCHHRYEGLW